MPYIRAEDRLKYDHVIGLINNDMQGACDSDIEYLVGEVIRIYLGENPRYDNFHSAIGTIECVRKEFCRRYRIKYFLLGNARSEPIEGYGYNAKYGHALGLLSHDMDKATPGDVNYIITRIIGLYVVNHGGSKSRVIEILEQRKNDLYDVTISKYEDSKIEENGDIPEYED